MTQPFRPSNGDHGEWFMGQFCFQCKRDDDEHEDYPCEILGRVLGLDIDDPDYPTEWIKDEDGSNPRCTAFEHVDDPDKPYRCEKTMEMQL